MNLGAIKKPLDLRDIKLGKVQDPVGIPEKYETDISWLKTLYQNGYPMCGSHAGAHFKAILDFLTEKEGRHYSPVYLWKKIKAFDGHAPEVGTDMRSILKALYSHGICDYDMLPTDLDLTLAEQTKEDTTPAQNANAQPRIIQSYAFGKTDIYSIKQSIYQNKAIIILIDIGDSWWKQKLVYPFTRRDGGHFVVAYGYDEDGILIVDSADRYQPFKKILWGYKIRDIGTAVDLPDWQVENLVKQKELLQKVVALLIKLIAFFTRI